MLRTMKRIALMAVVLGVLGYGLSGTAAGGAQEQGYWRAASSTAIAITGDVTLSDRRLVIGFATFAVAQIRELKLEEAAALFDGQTGKEGSGSLYRLDIPATRQFKRKNTLCGAESTAWMVTYAAGRDLRVAFFSGSAMPLLTAEGVANSTSLCGTFTYVR